MNKRDRSLPGVHETQMPGSVRIHESVVAAIVRKAVQETEGVIRLAGSSLVNNIAELVGSKSIQDRAISIDMKEDSSAAIEVRVILQYGVYIPDAAEKLRQTIAASVKEMTGMTISRVNVVVMDVEEPQEEESHP